MTYARKVKIRRRARVKRRRLTAHEVRVNREAKMLGCHLLLAALDVLEGDSVQVALNKAKSRAENLASARKRRAK
jgi:hypothetical protein